MINRYIIEPIANDQWRAFVEDRPDLPVGEGDAPTYALRALNFKLYGLNYERRRKEEAERKAAFKSMRHHFRDSIGFPRWAPTWSWLKTPEQRALGKAHYELVQKVAAEVKSWPELAETVNSRWTTCSVPAPE